MLAKHQTIHDEIERFAGYRRTVDEELAYPKAEPDASEVETTLDVAHR